MASSDDYKPAIVMFGLQFLYAGISLSSRAALLQGMCPTVFVVYRQSLATLIMTPIAYISRRKTSSSCSIGLRSFCLIFLASLIGVTMNMNFFNEGLFLASSSIASAMGNLVPAVTFVMATLCGLEQVNVRSLRSIAKIVGTIVCVSGAISMALLKGPKLLNTGFSLFDDTGRDEQNWLSGCLFLFGSNCCWSFWLILQVPVSASYPDHLSLSAWTCFTSAFQSALVALFLENGHVEAWSFDSYLEFAACLFTAIGAAISYFAQAWCIAKRGPFFSAMFNPLNTVIVTVLASILLHEQIYTGGLIGALGVTIGLYIVLWGKAQEIKEKSLEVEPKPQNSERKNVQIILDDETCDSEQSCRIDLKEPLLYNNSISVDESKTHE